MTSYLMALVMFASSLTIYKIFAKQIKYQKFDLEKEDRDQVDEKEDLRHSTENVLLRIGDFVSEFQLRRKILLHKRSHTQCDTGVDVYKQNLKADLPKKAAQVIFARTVTKQQIL